MFFTSHDQEITMSITACFENDERVTTYYLEEDGSFVGFTHDAHEVQMTASNWQLVLNTIGLDHVGESFVDFEASPTILASLMDAVRESDEHDDDLRERLMRVYDLCVAALARGTPRIRGT